MKQILVDTSAFYALADSADPAHAASREFLESNQVPLVTTNYVFAETLSLLTKRLGKDAAVRFGTGLRASEMIRLFRLPRDYDEDSWKEFLRFRDKGFDFIDSTCFVVMQRLGMETAFSFDRHFVQRGFRVVP